jgi:Tfp pilus assembly protein PilF
MGSSANMTISVALQELAKVTGDQSLLHLNEQEMERTLRAVFAFLLQKSVFVVKRDRVEITLPPIPPSSEAEASRLAAKAGQQAAKGEHAKAAGILKKVLELNPSHPTARRDLAMVCQQTGGFEGAKDLRMVALDHPGLEVIW